MKMSEARKEYMREYRRRHKLLCPICESVHIIEGSKTCRKCSSMSRVNAEDSTPLSELIYTKGHKSSAFALVRSRARSISPPSSCKNCGYSKHTEVCHIKPISSFPLSTPISVVNDPNNLVRLCPNCHWEFDHGGLQLQL